ncbi:hypothetical protein ACHQM5_017741 [Ranunculus cassubicifolius]
MASFCNSFVNRTSLHSLKTAFQAASRTSSPFEVPLSGRSTSRVQSLLLLHSAVAVARLNSCLSSTSRSCRSLSQELGLSVPR